MIPDRIQARFAFRGKSEEIKLEVTRAPTIRLRMRKLIMRRTASFRIFTDRFARCVGRKRLKPETYTASEAIKSKFENAECFSS